MRTIIEDYKYFSDKRFSTLAGTLVYFLLMSVAPFLFWLTLIAGNVDLSAIGLSEYLTAVEPVILHLQTAAQSAAGGAGIILLLTTLWSSTNFFYHLRRSGEIIFGVDFKKGGIKLRLQSLFAVFAIIIVITIATAIPIFSVKMLSTIMPQYLAQIISTAFLVLCAFVGAYLLNSFACPYRLTFDETIAGVLLTVTLWLLCAIGFSVYLNYANPQRLYGAIAAVIVFMLWCYLMVNSLVIGIIYNGKYCRRQNRAALSKNGTG